MWNADQYTKFSSHRDRPFFDLMARVEAANPASVVDLGCGTGHLTASLLERWPEARVLGVDSSPQMLEKAVQYAVPGRLEFIEADLRAWQPKEQFDVIVTNAALQWVPDHETLIPRLARLLKDDGWLAVQMPANFDAPSHTLIREVSALEPFKAHLNKLEGEPRTQQSILWYIETLSSLSFEVDAWTTEYQQTLHGQNPVLEWVKGTALRPVLNALPTELHDSFLSEYGARLLKAYPESAFGTVLPFKRVFFVARRV
jgi:trans-aconitate 2-methyltransferase